MDLAKKLFILLLVFFVFSCSSKKSVLYVQDLNNNLQYKNDYSEHVVRADDILKISISTDNPETMQMFSASTRSEFNDSRESLTFKGFYVDKEGYINYPSLGRIKVSGFKTTEVRTLLYNKLVELQIFVDPNVDVKVLNLNFTVLGEVKNPGKYFFDNNINLLQALGVAGDLTINGNRNDIKLIRDINGTKDIYTIDLTKSNFLENNIYQIFSGDIIIVNPNTSRIKNAGIIGNSGTLLSLLSFLLSSIIIISN